MKKEINAEMGFVDILINNAGLMPTNSFREGEPDDIKRVMDVNVLAHFWVVFEALYFSSFDLMKIHGPFVLDDSNFYW